MAAQAGKEVKSSSKMPVRAAGDSIGRGRKSSSDTAEGTGR
jgi:hypothetical protein